MYVVPIVKTERGCTLASASQPCRTQVAVPRCSKNTSGWRARHSTGAVVKIDGGCNNAVAQENEQSQMQFCVRCPLTKMLVQPIPPFSRPGVMQVHTGASSE